MSRYTIDMSDEDRQYLAEYDRRIKQLCDLVLEIVRDEPKLLLSQTFRKILVDNADTLEKMWWKFHNHLMVDNPGKPLEGDG